MSVSAGRIATIWKFVLEPECSLDMPAGAQVLSIREQGDSICLWALVDPSASTERRRFIVFGTGHPVPDEPLTYSGPRIYFKGSLFSMCLSAHPKPPASQTH
jgi:hypothetical protein